MREDSLIAEAIQSVQKRILDRMHNNISSLVTLKKTPLCKVLDDENNRSRNETFHVLDPSGVWVYKSSPSNADTTIKQPVRELSTSS